MKTIEEKVAAMRSEVAAAEKLHGQAPKGVVLQMGWAEKALAQGDSTKAEGHWLQVFGWLRAPQGYGPAGRMPW